MKKGIYGKRIALMARPERHDIDYFPFVIKDGKTLFILETKYQCKGTGFFTNLLRFLSRTPDHYFQIKDEADQMYFFASTKCDADCALDMIKIMVTTGKLDKELWEQEKIIASSDFLDSIQEAYRKRSNKCITLEDIKSKYRITSAIDSPVAIQNDETSAVNSLNSAGKSPVNQVSTKRQPDVNQVSTESQPKEQKLIPYQEIIEYLNGKAGKHFSHTSQETKRLIKARWNQGFELDAFKFVIDVKCTKWLTDPKMIDYIRPQTLFGTKFESYLNETTTISHKLDPVTEHNFGVAGRYLKNEGELDDR